MTYATAAAAAALQLREEVGSADALPIDVEDIARVLGVDVVYEDLDDDVSGMLICTEAHRAILVNRTHHSNRQRFTIAHELGHLRLHADDSAVFVDGRTRVFFREGKTSAIQEPREIEANAFAAELLMPAAELQRLLASGRLDAIDDGDMAALAAKFHVSVQALTIRLMNLGLVTSLTV